MCDVRVNYFEQVEENFLYDSSQSNHVCTYKNNTRLSLIQMVLQKTPTTFMVPPKIVRCS